VRNGRAKAKAPVTFVAPSGDSGLHLLDLFVGKQRTTVPILVQSRERARMLVVVPTMTWTGTEAVDEDHDGIFNTFATGAPVSWPRVQPDGLPSDLVHNVGPVLRFLDKAGVRYDLTSDLDLALSDSPRASDRKAVLLAGSMRWAFNEMQERLRRYVQDGGSDAAVRDLLPQALYLSNEFKAAAEELEPRVAADEAAGRAPPEEMLRLLISCYVQLKDDAGYQRTLERMAVAYPKPDYWSELLSRATKQPGFSDRLWLDVYRLRFAAGLMRGADEYVEMANLALQAGYPSEALKVIDRGVSLALLGNGKDAAAHTALRERASKAAEKDSADLARAEAAAKGAREGDALVNVGLAYASAGQAAKGVQLMEQGVAKGGLKRADEARLHLGQALWQAGRKDDAVKALAAVQGSDGTAALARVWSAFVRSPAGKI